jgi:hypothetical protein
MEKNKKRTHGGRLDILTYYYPYDIFLKNESIA